MEVVNLQKIQTTGMIPSVITDFILLSGFFYRPISGLWYFKPIPAIPAIPARKLYFQKLASILKILYVRIKLACEYHRISCKYFAGIDCGYYVSLTPYLLHDSIQFHLFQEY